MKKIICKIFGHKMNIEKNPRPPEYFMRVLNWECSRCGETENIFQRVERITMCRWK